jgi:transcriptional regulator with XRE-family HTH domain
MTIGENIKLKRESIGMSRSELIDKAGISTAQVSRIERGEQKNPNLETLVAISTALNTSIDEIVFGDQSTSSVYLSQMIDRLPKEKKEFIKEMIKMAVMVSSSEQIEAGMKEEKKTGR